MQYGISNSGHHVQDIPRACLSPQLTLRERDNPGLPSWVQCSHKDPGHTQAERPLAHFPSGFSSSRAGAGMQSVPNKSP